MTHTKGPWNIDRNNVHAGTIATLYGCRDNTYVDIWSTNWPENAEQQDANALLIAAAPELLAACKAALRGFRLLILANDLTDEEREQIQLLQSAITKAEEGG